MGRRRSGAERALGSWYRSSVGVPQREGRCGRRPARDQPSLTKVFVWEAGGVFLQSPSASPSALVVRWAGGQRSQPPHAASVARTRHDERAPAGGTSPLSRRGPGAVLRRLSPALAPLRARANIGGWRADRDGSRRRQVEGHSRVQAGPRALPPAAPCRDAEDYCQPKLAGSAPLSVPSRCLSPLTYHLSPLTSRLSPRTSPLTSHVSPLTHRPPSQRTS